MYIFKFSLGGMGKQNTSVELSGFQVPLQKLFSKTHVEATIFQIFVGKCHETIFFRAQKT